MTAPPAPPGESLEDRLWREAADEAWVEKLRALTVRRARDLQIRASMPQIPGGGGWRPHE